jgi:hypothetical protein
MAGLGPATHEFLVQAVNVPDPTRHPRAHTALVD